MNGRRLVVGLILVCLVVVPLGVAAADYSLSTNAEHDVPNRDVDFEGDTHTITSLSRVDEGDTLTVDVSGPADKGYDVNLYTPENQIADSAFVGGGDATVTFDMSFTPGSYALVIEQDGDTKKIHPVVIKAYGVTHSGPGSVESGASVDVPVDVTDLGSEKDINYVQVVLSNDTTEVTDRATESGGSYDATLPTDDLGPGEYSLYATVRGTEEVRDRDELLGFSDRTTVTIESDSEESDDVSGGEGGGGAIGGTGNETTSDGNGTDATGSAVGLETLDATPETELEVPIADAAPDTPGMTVTFANTTTVSRVTFNNESVTGSVAVAEYGVAPDSVASALTDWYASQRGTTVTETAVLRVVDIAPTSQAASDSAATVELTVPRDILDEPESAVILHQPSNGTWERPETTVAVTGSGGGEVVRLRASLDSFSLFAVVDESAATADGTATPTDSPTPTADGPETATATPTQTPESVVTPQPTATDTATPTPGASGPGFTAIGALIALLSGLGLVHRQHS